MASITSWNRLEPRVRDPKMRNGLAARVRDPLWILSRQWQIGEFDGHDGGSAVHAKINTKSSMLNRFSPGSFRESDGLSGYYYNPVSMPLETLVERETTSMDSLKSLGHAVEMGLHFLRLLAYNGLDENDFNILHNFPIEPPDAEIRESIDPDNLRLWLIMSGRVPDGIALYKKLSSEFEQRNSDDYLNIEDQKRYLYKETVIIWLNWCEESFFNSTQEKSSWVRERLEYQFAVSAPAGDGNGEFVLGASEYSEGHLDWHSFDYFPNIDLNIQGDKFLNDIDIRESESLVIPAPVFSRGMPASRWWQFEDSSYDFGAVEVAPEDLIRLPWMQFALLHARDWLIIPVDLPVGSLSWVDSLTITDSFGEKIPIESVNRVDPSSPRLFQLTSKYDNAKSSRPLEKYLEGLFLPPVLGPSLHGKPIEEVLFFRDEMANMAWAVEKVVEGVAGQPVNRQEAYDRKKKNGVTQPNEVVEGAELTYSLFKEVPGHWIPLVPVKGDNDERSRWLRPGIMGSYAGNASLSEGSQGRILESEGPLLLYNEQVPRKSIYITRTYQYARWIDGSNHLWIGRQKNPGRGQVSSGLVFDAVDPVKKE